MRVIPSGRSLGAVVEDIDLARPLSADEDRLVVAALGERGVLRFPGQKLDAGQLKRFAARFGDLEVNVASGAYQEPGHPEVMILSNIVENGRPIGMADAGQDWHTDMSYSKTIAFANVLYGIHIPRRNGSARPPLTEEQRRKKPPVSQPIFLKHPISGRMVLYANPGYAVRIDGMPEHLSLIHISEPTRL